MSANGKPTASVFRWTVFARVMRSSSCCGLEKTDKAGRLPRRLWQSAGGAVVDSPPLTNAPSSRRRRTARNSQASIQHSLAGGGGGARLILRYHTVPKSKYAFRRGTRPD